MVGLKNWNDTCQKQKWSNGNGQPYVLQIELARYRCRAETWFIRAVWLLLLVGYTMTVLFSLATIRSSRMDARWVSNTVEGQGGVEIGRKERNFLRGTGKYELTEFLFPSFIDSPLSDNILSRKYRRPLNIFIRYWYTFESFLVTVPPVVPTPLHFYRRLSYFSHLLENG